MNSFGATIRDNKILFVFIIIMLFGAGLGSLAPRTDSFVWLNQHHTKSADRFLQYFTFLGDGFFSIAAGIVIFLIGRRIVGWHVTLAYFVSGLLAQVLKKISMMPRPRALITDGSYQYFIDGVTHSGWNSFPSGHTTSVFALATILSLHVKNPLLQVLFFLLATAVGYSRIYLGQHFLVDCLGGALIGILTGVMVYQYIALPKAWRRKQAKFSKLARDQKHES